MILDIGNGRELRLPDETSDETAQLLGRLILALEERAAKAEADADRLSREFAALKAMPAAPVKREDTADTVTHGLLMEANSLLKRLLVVSAADRVLITDAMGRSRSRVTTERE